MKTEVYVEFYGEQVSESSLVETAKKIWTDAGNKAADFKSVELYLKPEEDRVYYVINGSETGSFEILNNQNDM